MADRERFGEQMTDEERKRLDEIDSYCDGHSLKMAKDFDWLIAQLRAADEREKRLDPDHEYHMSADADRVLRASVPERWKGCTSPIGAVQAYIAELEMREKRLVEAIKFMLASGPMVGEAWTRFRAALAEVKETKNGP